MIFQLIINYNTKKCYFLKQIININLNLVCDSINNHYKSINRKNNGHIQIL